MDEVYKIVDNISNIKVAQIIKKLINKIHTCSIEDVSSAYHMLLGSLLMAEVVNELSRDDGKKIINTLKSIVKNRLSQSR